jgi:ABC-type transport system involved in multi-copper enzyme maturation permease subunit
MTYLIWRQHRNQLFFASGALAALVLILLPTGVHLASSYHAGLRDCAASGSCGDLGNSLFRNYGLLFDLIGLTAAVPALFGLFWGAPLVASEIEAGTHQLAWTQTVTRRRWLAAKAGWILLAAAVWGAAMSALVTWWSGPVNAINESRFNLGHFDTQGIVPIGYAVFAVALGITVGAVLRRVLPALAVTLGVFTTVRFAIDYGIRQHYVTPLTKVLPLGGQAAIASGSFWMIGSRIITPLGQASDGINLSTLPAACRGLVNREPVTQCLGTHGWRIVSTYQPSSRFWAFQGIETAIYVGLALGLLALSFRVVARTDG